MNLSLADTLGGMLLFRSSRSTAIHARTTAIFISGSPGERGIRLYEYFVAKAQGCIDKVETGEFGAMMDVELVNDGPVTIILDSEKTI